MQGRCWDERRRDDAQRPSSRIRGPDHLSKILSQDKISNEIDNTQQATRLLRRWFAGNCLPRVSIWYSVVPETRVREIRLLDDLLQTAHELVHRAHPVLVLIRAVFERRERDRSVVYDHPDLVPWS